MKPLAAKIVPKLQNFWQKQHRMDFAQEMLTTFNDDPDFHKKVIASEESWVYGYDIETKAQLSQWKRPEEPRPTKARQVRSNVNALLTVFYDFNCVMHHEFLSQGHTFNKEFVRNSQSCGKTNHGFCTVKMHQLIHRCLCVP